MPTHLPTHIRPIIRQPATEACITGTVSASSASNTLQEKLNQLKWKNKYNKAMA